MTIVNSTLTSRKVAIVDIDMTDGEFVSLAGADLAAWGAG
jgi:hypothetical protein